MSDDALDPEAAAKIEALRRAADAFILLDRAYKDSPHPIIAELREHAGMIVRREATTAIRSGTEARLAALSTQTPRASAPDG